MAIAITLLDAKLISRIDLSRCKPIAIRATHKTSTLVCPIKGQDCAAYVTRFCALNRKGHIDR